MCRCDDEYERPADSADEYDDVFESREAYEAGILASIRENEGMGEVEERADSTYYGVGAAHRQRATRSWDAARASIRAYVTACIANESDDSEGQAA